MNQAQDFMGREITVGCTLVYPWRRGSDMGMNELRVQQIVDRDPKKVKVAGYNKDGRRITIGNLNNTVVVSPRELATAAA